MRKRLTAALTAGVLILSLTGCGENQIPDLTDEQLQIVGEYAAITLMKYDSNHRSRLVDYTDMLLAPEPVPEVTPTPTPQEPAGMDPVDDTPVIGPSGGTSNVYTMAEVLELPEGVSVQYVGAEFHDKYPEGDVVGFALTAAAGKKLLVLNFSLTNAGEQDAAIDLLSKDAEFRITVNGDYTRKVLPTILENDLSTYMGTVPGAGSVGTVLVIEVDASVEGNLSSISFDLKNGEKAYTIQLL